MAQESMGLDTDGRVHLRVLTGEGETTVVLRLRGAPKPRARAKVYWAEDMVDSEGLGRKSSKGMSSTIMTSLELHSRSLGLL
jgi:hypothetical protein